MNSIRHFAWFLEAAAIVGIGCQGGGLQAGVTRGWVHDMFGLPMQDTVVILENDAYKEIARAKTGNQGEFVCKVNGEALYLSVGKGGYDRQRLEENGKYYLRPYVTPERIRGLAEKEGDAFYTEMCELMASSDRRGMSNDFFKLGDKCLPYLIRALKDGRPIMQEPFPNRAPQPTVRLRAAYFLARLGRIEGIQALKDILKGNIRNPLEKVAIKCILASALGESVDEQDMELARSCLLNAKQCMWLVGDVVYMLGISTQGEALNILRGITVDKDEFHSGLLLRALSDALQWHRNKNKGTFRPMPSDSEETIIEKTIRNTLIFDNPQDYDLIIGFEPKLVVFNPKRDRAMVDIAIGKGYKANRGLDVLLKRSDIGWTVIGVWHAWVS